MAITKPTLQMEAVVLPPEDGGQGEAVVELEALPEPEQIIDVQALDQRPLFGFQKVKVVRVEWVLREKETPSRGMQTRRDSPSLLELTPQIYTSGHEEIEA